jgi:hypothetical protein
MERGGGGRRLPGGDGPRSVEMRLLLTLASLSETR